MLFCMKFFLAKFSKNYMQLKRKTNIFDNCKRHVYYFVYILLFLFFFPSFSLKLTFFFSQMAVDKLFGMSSKL